ncbi:MAG: glycosyltransferase family 4 protein [Planctomycetota bacterium]|jgi:glycosyltransferase involved in cell wall biosynthesis
MRVLYHHRTLATDAQGVHIRAMIEAWRDLGHVVDEVSLVGSQDEASPRTGGERNGFWGWLRRGVPQICYEFLEYGYSPVGYRRLVAAIDEGPKPAFIYERYSLGNAAGIWASRRRKIPVIIEVNAPVALEKACYEGLKLPALASYMERRILSQAGRVVTVTGVLKKILVDEGIPEERIAVLPNGVKRGEFRPHERGERIRAELGIKPDDLVVGFVGWFRAWHGLDRLVDLAAHPEAKRARIVVLLVGDGPARPDLQARIERRGLAPSVRMLGAQKRAAIPEILSAFDIAVQPAATRYACPLKLIEYLASGKPVVAPRQENIQEIVRDEESALLFDPADGDALPRSVLGLARSSERRRAIARNGLAVIEKKGLYWEENARRVIDLAPDAGRR